MTKNTNTKNVTFKLNTATPTTIGSAIISVATLIVFAIGMIWGNYNSTHYSTVAEVFTVDSTETIFIDGAGYLWSALDTEYKKGEFVELYFDNNCTDYTRKDDKIVKIKRLDN